MRISAESLGRMNFGSSTFFRNRFKNQLDWLNLY